MATLERAIEIAARVHAGQRDKAGEPYILHPLRVMLSLGGKYERMAAILLTWSRIPRQLEDLAREARRKLRPSTLTKRMASSAGRSGPGCAQSDRPRREARRPEGQHGPLPPSDPPSATSPA